MTAHRPNVAYTSDDHAFRESDPYARAKYELTLRWLRPYMHPEALIYNVGVGSGYFNHLAVKRGLRVVGCEPDPFAFAAAIATAPPGVEIVNATLTDFAKGRPRADIVVMHDVLEHIEDDAGAIERLHDLVQPGGRIVLSVPALPSLFGLHDEQLGHHRRYTARSLRRLLAPRFTIPRLQWFGLTSIPIAYYYSRWKRIPYPVGALKSAAGTIYERVCEFESHLPLPIGTSLIAELLPR